MLILATHGTRTIDEVQSTVRSDKDVQYSMDVNARRSNGGPSQNYAPARVEFRSCADHEQSYHLPKDVVCHGLFTHSLNEILEQYSWDMTKVMHTKKPEQE